MTTEKLLSTLVIKRKTDVIMPGLKNPGRLNHSIYTTYVIRWDMETLNPNQL